MNALASMPSKKIINESPRASILDKLFDPSRAFLVFVFSIFFAYFVVPASIFLSDSRAFSFLHLSIMALLSVVSMFVGYYLPILDSRFSVSAKRFVVPQKIFVYVLWIIFVLFVSLTFVTSSAIPLLSALSGASAVDLSLQRGAFMKGREGIQASFGYVIALMNTFIPYTILLLYQTRSRLRHFAAIGFLFYSLSFMAKSLFFNLAIPALALMADNKRLKGFIVVASFAFIGFILSVMFIFSHSENLTSLSDTNYFSSAYLPQNPLDFMIWRSFGVPVFTAADALVVHKDLFKSVFLMGSTSGLLAFLAGVDRVNIEREVFAYQFGGWNDIANANYVFFVDSYVNFSWFGILFSGLLVGQVFRWLRLSSDKALRSQSLSFGFMLFNAPFINILFGAGWLYMIFHLLFVKLKTKNMRQMVE